MFIRPGLFHLLFCFIVLAPIILDAANPLPAPSTAEAFMADTPPPPPPPPLSEENAQALKTLVDRQKSLIHKAENAQTQTEIDDLYPELQSLINDYEDFLKKTPQNPEPYISYGMLLNSSTIGERKRAAALFYKADTLNPNIALVKNQLANYLAEEGRPVQAVSHYFAAINLDPQEPLYHYQLGNLLSSAREDLMKEMGWPRSQVDTTMLNAFRQAASLGSNNSTYGFRLGLAYFEIQNPDWESALAQWTSLEKTTEGPLQKQLLNLYIAKIYINQKKVEEAQKHLDAVTDERYQVQKQKLLDELKTIQSK